MARTPTYPLGLPEEQRRRWQEEADKAGVSLAEFIRQSVEARIAGTDPNAAQERPVGIVTSGPKPFRGMDTKQKPLRRA